MKRLTAMSPKRKKKGSVSANSTDPCECVTAHPVNSVNPTRLPQRPAIPLGHRAALMLVPVHLAAFGHDRKEALFIALPRALRVGACKNPASDTVLGEASAYQDDDGSGTRGGRAIRAQSHGTARVSQDSH